MNTLTIDTGIQAYKLNDEVEVHFNPTDTKFVEGIYKAFIEVSKRQEEYAKGKAAIKEDDIDAMLDFAETEDAAMRAIIDNAFDVPICDKIFKGINIFARTKEGIPVWANLFLAILDECDADLATVDARENKAIEKYTKKYAKNKRK